MRTGPNWKMVLGISMIAIGTGMLILDNPGNENSIRENSDLNMTAQDCSDWAQMNSSEDFKLLNNIWGTENVRQCVRTYSEGSVGWSWERNWTGSTDPNYPEVLHGTKPWGNKTGSEIFPARIGEIESMEVSRLQIDTDVNGSGEWNTAFEFWITSEEPEGDVSRSITDEVIIFLESENMDSANLIEEDAVDDGCNSYSYYRYRSSNIGHDYHQFRLEGEKMPGKIDVKPFLDYVVQRNSGERNYSDSWVSGFELGNEYWDDTSGETVVRQLDYSVNGQQESLKGNHRIFDIDFCRGPWEQLLN